MLGLVAMLGGKQGRGGFRHSFTSASFGLKILELGLIYFFEVGLVYWLQACWRWLDDRHSSTALVDAGVEVDFLLAYHTMCVLPDYLDQSDVAG